MKKTVLAAFIALQISIAGTAFAAPAASSYAQFMQSLDRIATDAVLPVADELSFSAPFRSAQPIIANAKNLLGLPVVWGWANPAQGFDCSGFVQYVFRQAGVNLPRTADLQFLVGRSVSKTALQAGDLVYFTTYAPGASHVGIYLGQGQFIHTSWSQGVIAISDLNERYFTERYYGAKRIL